MITYLTDEKKKSKKYKKIKMLSTSVKSFITFVIIASTSISITSFVTVTGSIVMQNIK